MAAAAAGVCEKTVHNRKIADPAFAAELLAAKREGVSRVRQRALDKTLDAWGQVDPERYAWGKREEVGHNTRLIGMLNAADREAGLVGRAAQAAVPARTREALEAAVLGKLELLARRLATGAHEEGAPPPPSPAIAGEDVAAARKDRESIADLLTKSGEERAASVRARKTETLERWDALWAVWAHAGQLPPPGNWRVWLLMAGRGFGKTRAGAEWVSAQARADGDLRVALVGATEADARDVMVEGPSGLLNVGPPHARPRWTEGRGRLVWPSGAVAFTFSGAAPEGLRGPEHHIAWCDELGKWARGEATWSNLMLGLRLGPPPRALVTTTPRPTPLMRRLADEAGQAGGAVVRTWGETRDNLALSPVFAAEMEKEWGGTRLGRQELGGELIEDVEGSLWPRELIERCRVEAVRHVFDNPHPNPAGRPLGPFGERACCPAPGGEGLPFVRIVVGVDPPATAGGDACGIVVVGLDEDGRAVVLEDATVAGRSPEGWARAVAGAAAHWGADRVVAEVNQGGDMVESVLRGADVALPVRKVHAARGKVARAEPVAALYERGAMVHAGAFPELEDQLAGLAAGGYVGPGRSPDRADALIWAATELLLKRARAAPRITQL